MSKISIVELVFENCIILELPINAFVRFSMKRIGAYFPRANDTWQLKEKFHAYGGISFTLAADISQFRWTNTITGKEVDWVPHTHEEILRRLRVNDITYLTLCYEDGGGQCIRVPYEERTDDDTNLLQSTSVDAEGQITVIIRPAQKND